MSVTLDVAATVAAVEAYLAEHEAGLVAFRRRLHAAPETSGHEVATTEAIEQQLLTAGLAPTRLAVGTGLVCDIGSGTGPVVALRADIDALAMADGKDVPYRSRTAGVTHACGHDVHVAVVLGAGMALYRSGLPAGGRVRLVFEPSEESVPGGAVDVIAEGWFDEVAAVFGLHCDPKLDVGTVGVRAGALTSAADLVAVQVHGPGGHTARPAQTVDLVGVLGRLVSELPRHVEAQAPGAVRLVFGAIHAGDASNVIPAEGVLRGTLRTPDHEVWAVARELVETGTASVLAGTGATWTVEHRRGVPPVLNDLEATDVLSACVRAAMGEQAVVPTAHSWGGDSFAWYTERVPGSYARLGVHDPRSPGLRLDLHAATFDVDERAIGHGVRVLATTAVAMLDLLTHH